MSQVFLGLALICEKCKSLMDTEACVDIHCAGQLAKKGKMLMEKLVVGQLFIHSVTHTRHREMCMQTENCMIYNQKA